MRGVVDAGEGVEVEVRVALCGGDAAVAQQFLHSPQVCAAFQQMRGEGVPHIVRGNVLGYACQLGMLIEEAGRLPAVQPFAALAEEDSPLAMQGRDLVASFQPAGQCGRAGIAEQYLPLL